MTIKNETKGACEILRVAYAQNYLTQEFTGKRNTSLFSFAFPFKKKIKI